MLPYKLLTFIDLKTGEELDAPPEALAVAIGNFDGVHLGHARLISVAIEETEKMQREGMNISAGVFCFLVPPADILMSSPPPHICTLEEKLELFRTLGAPFALVANFELLKDLSAEEFCKFLKDTCNCKAVFCGFNFRFGAQGRGDISTLKEAFGENATAIDAFTTEDGVPISSSRIRRLIADGELEEAGRLLGRPFSFEGEVLHGKALGKILGFPTLNQNLPADCVVPKKGIYVSVAEIDGKRYKAVTNVGSRPTFEAGAQINCESHIIDFDADLYGRQVRLYLLKRIRDEIKFDDRSQLIGAISSDVETAKGYFEKNTDYL